MYYIYYYIFYKVKRNNIKKLYDMNKKYKLK